MSSSSSAVSSGGLSVFRGGLTWVVETSGRYASSELEVATRFMLALDNGQLGMTQQIHLNDHQHTS